MTICIVEDDEPLLHNLRLLLDGDPKMSVLGSYKNAEEALKAAPWKKTDIFLVDIDLPGMDGVELIRRVHPLNPNMRVITHTIHDDKPTVLEAVKAGASGYLTKGCTPSQLVTALYEIYEGGAPMSPAIARLVLGVIQEQSEDPATPPGETLTMRERDILRLLEQGLAYKEIADRLSISVYTVHSHIKNTYAKLHARDKLDAIRKGRYRNFI